MPKIWYPVIDYEKCVNCGDCVDMCKHGVYDLKRVPTPVVINPDNCIKGCHGCGNLCPSKAISYVDDQNLKGNNCCCSCGDDKKGGCC